MTVCEIQRNDADRRLTAVFDGKPDPGIEVGSVSAPGPDVAPGVETAPRDLEVEGRDQIGSYLYSQFQGQKMVRVVSGILRAQGFWVKERPEAGADGGVDAVAGRGSLGLDSPRIVVQVKVRADQVGTGELDALEGTIAKFGADHGLIVSWGGFSSKAREQARVRGFKLRCWDQWDLITGITENWDRLPDDLRADLPFQRIWTISPSAAEPEA
jgi:restriction system protein